MLCCLVNPDNGKTWKHFLDWYLEDHIKCNWRTFTLHTEERTFFGELLSICFQRVRKNELKT